MLASKKHGKALRSPDESRGFVLEEYSTNTQGLREGGLVCFGDYETAAGWIRFDAISTHPANTPLLSPTTPAVSRCLRTTRPWELLSGVKALRLRLGSADAR